MKEIVTVVTDAGYRSFLNELDKWDGVAIDIESTGKTIPPHSVLGIGIVGFNVDLENPGETLQVSENIYYVPVKSPEFLQYNMLDTKNNAVCVPLEIPQVKELIDKLSEKKIFAGHNLKFDLHGLAHIGLKVRDDAFTLDTRPLFRFISKAEKVGEEGFSLGILMDKYLGKRYSQYKKDISQYIKKHHCKECGKTNEETFASIPFYILKEYCGRDSMAVIDLLKYLWITLPDHKELELVI